MPFQAKPSQDEPQVDIDSYVFEERFHRAILDHLVNDVFSHAPDILRWDFSNAGEGLVGKGRASDEVIMRFFPKYERFGEDVGKLYVYDSNTKAVSGDRAHWAERQMGRMFGVDGRVTLTEPTRHEVAKSIDGNLGVVTKEVEIMEAAE